MATVFVALEHGRPVVVAEHQDTSHVVIPFKDDSALVAWVGHDITPALLEEVPTGHIMLGAEHNRAIGIFAKMLREILTGHGLLSKRTVDGVHLMKHEVIIATRRGVWRIDHAFQIHGGAYACIGNGARPAEAIFGELMNSYKDVSELARMLRALHFAREFDNRAKGPYRCHIIRLLAPAREQVMPEVARDPFTLPLQPKLNIRD